MGQVAGLPGTSWFRRLHPKVDYQGVHLFETICVLRMLTFSGHTSWRKNRLEQKYRGLTKQPHDKVNTIQVAITLL